MKYLIMECRNAYAVVLCEDGTFLKVANMHYEVGQEVTDVIPLKLPQTVPQKQKPRQWVSAFAVMAACLTLMLSGLFFSGGRTWASVYMTINPQVRIDVNRADRVLAIEPLNEDGVILLEGYDHARKDLELVMDDLADRAVDLGYLHQGGRIALHLDGSEDWVTDHETQLQEHLQEHLQVTVTVTVAREEQPPVSTLPKPIVIPLEESDYDDTDYGSSDYDGSDYAEFQDSGYGEEDEEVSDYREEDRDTGGSENRGSAPAREDSSDYGDSGYDESDYGEDGDD